MWVSTALLAGGLVCAGIGGELFLRAVVGAATAWRISAALAGATVAAFATSSPELAVAVTSALAGTPEISLGDCVGSNVVNVALILGGALLLRPLNCSRESLQRDLPMALLAPLLTGALAADGRLSRLDGGLMIAAFFAWVFRGWHRSRQGIATPGREPQPVRLLVLSGLGGLLLLVAASRLIVEGGLGVAARLGWTPFVVGTIIVSVGTSVPEIVTTLLARWRGQDDIGLGTVLGSNVFNLLFIVAVAALLHPIRVAGPGPWVGLGLGVVAIGVAYPRRDGVIGRAQGIALLGCYLVQVAATLLVPE